MKKIVCLILTFACILTALWGCDSLNRQPVTLGDSISIPENGIVQASVFEELKTENKAVTFQGKAGEIRYEWVIFGGDIREAKALNLGIEVTEASGKQLAFRFCSDEDFGFSPMLSIYLNEAWDAQNASALAGGDIRQEVTLTAHQKQTVLNFSPKVQTGAFVITPNTPQESTEPPTQATSPEETNPTQTTEPSQVTAPPETQAPPAATQVPEPPQVTAPPETQAIPTESQEPAVSEQPTESVRPTSDGKDTQQDEHKTDPVPEGKPLPVEPEDQQTDTRITYTCTFSIECTSIFNHLSDLEPEKLDILPKDGIIFAPQTVTFYEGESVYDVLQRVCRENRIHLEASFTPMYNSAYVEGIGNLYEFDCGGGSGWMYRVDGWYPNYGCSRYQLKQGETVEFRYTCDLGEDIGGGAATRE